MRIKYDKDADVLIVILKDDNPVDAIEEPGGVIISYNIKREPISIEILNASEKLNLKEGELSLTLQS